MEQSILLDPADRADEPEVDSERDDGTHEVLPDLAYKRLAISNVVFYGEAGATDRHWVLIDAGVPGSAALIARAAERRFGADSRPGLIVLTHGHVDHVGALAELAARWGVPVFAHRWEQPYLDGSEAYPPPDPSVGGGLISLLSPLFPHGPIDVRPRLNVLPDNGDVPGMDGWQWLHTPGHSPGHVSLWREDDRTLIVGDAFITTAQESAYAVVTQRPEMHGPPKFLTPDWVAARASVELLAALEPELVICGHGRAMRGPAMRDALHLLARDFDEIAVPERGRYVEQGV